MLAALLFLIGWPRPHVLDIELRRPALVRLNPDDRPDSKALDWPEGFVGLFANLNPFFETQQGCVDPKVLSRCRFQLSGAS